MPFGVCKMCLQEKNLVSSHLIPRKVYEYCNRKGHNPIVLAGDVLMASDRAAATDSNGPLIRAWLNFKFPTPVKSEEPAVYVPDLRSGPEKLKDAKASVRQS
jgi:hypothetical protein